MNFELFMRDRSAITNWREEWIKENAKVKRLESEIAAIRAQLADQQNDPLTLEELRERTKPVWCAVPGRSWIPEGGYYCLCEKGMITAPSKRTFRAEECLKNGWVLLDRPPEE